MHQEVDGVLEGTWLELVSIVNDNHRGLVVIIRNESSHFSPPIRRRYFIIPGVELRVFLQPQRLAQWLLVMSGFCAKYAEGMHIKPHSTKSPLELFVMFFCTH